VLLHKLEDTRQLLDGGVGQISTLALLVMLLLLLVVLAAVMLLLASVVTTTAAMVLTGPEGLAALQVDVDPAGILLGAILQAQLAAQLLDLGLELLDVVGRVVALADDGVQVLLAAGLILADPKLEDALGLLDELAVQVDGVGLDAAWGVVLAEDKVRRLPVVLVHLCVMTLALVG
jgi:hypothetical protein